MTANTPRLKPLPSAPSPQAATDTQVALTLGEIGALHQSLGQFWDAEKAYLRALKILERHHLNEPLAKTLNDLATFPRDQAIARTRVHVGDLEKKR